jgi:hypothetical protein
MMIGDETTGVLRLDPDLVRARLRWLSYQVMRTVRAVLADELCEAAGQGAMSKLEDMVVKALAEDAATGRTLGEVKELLRAAGGNDDLN